MLEALKNLILRRSRPGILSHEDLSALIAKNKTQIINDFVNGVRAEIPNMHSETRSYLVDHIPLVIKEMIEFLSTNGSSKDYVASAWFAAIHGKQRAESDTFTLKDLRTEHSILRSVILNSIPEGWHLSARARDLLSEIFSLNLSHATEVFLRNTDTELQTHSTEKKQFVDNLIEAHDDRTRAENERKWFEEAMNQLPKPLFLLNRDEGTVSFSNKAARDMLGLHYADVDRLAIYDSIITVYAADGRKLNAEELPSSRVLRGETIQGEEFLLSTPVGKFHIKIFSAQLPKAFDQPASAMILFQDITTLKSVETDLREAETDLSKAIEIAQVGFWYVDVATSKTFLTPILLNQFGYDPTKTDVSFEEATRAIHPDDKELVVGAINTSIKKGTPYHIEFRILRPDGQMRWIEAKGGVSEDAKGKPLRFTGTTLDITNRVRAREKLEASERELRFLADSMPQIVWSAKPNGELDYFNEVWFTYSGSTHKDNVGHGWTQFVHPEDLPETSRRWEHSLKTLALYENEFRLRSKSGAYRWHMVRAVPVFDKGLVVKWFGTNTDIHDRMRLEAQLTEAKSAAERANSAKSQFLANMSHEIRTPLGAIMGFAGLLRESTLSTEQNNYATVIERNSKQLLRIIDDILDLSKVEAGMMTIEHIEFDFTEMLVDISSLMGLKAREKGVSFNIRAANKIPKILNTDPTRLRQILLNVIGNAIKFTDRGMIEIRVTFNNNLLEFEVEDTGRGISPEQRENLFQPFAQADPSITRQFGGTGLGLALSRSLAGALGGSFDLKRSEIGKGSVFHIAIQAKAKNEADFFSNLVLENTDRAPSKPPSELQGKKILLVEDSPDNQTLIKVYLANTGAITEIASDGSEGSTMVFEKNYDLVLMDVQMPVMDGITAIKHMRKKGYTKPVIALTAHAMKEERERCIVAGFSDFLSKPVRKDELIRAIVKNLT